MKIIYRIEGSFDEIIHDTSIISEVPQRGDEVILLTENNSCFHGIVTARILDYKRECIWVHLKKY